MATSESQKQWRDRSRAGLVRHCTNCQKRLRAESTRDLCKSCWMKTPEGKDYNRLQQQKHREKSVGNRNSSNVWHCLPTLLSNLSARRCQVVCQRPVGVFYNPTNIPSKLEYVERQFDLTAQKVAIELFRINGGKPGYYLANLRDRKYYYCGSEWKDVGTTLQSLGIGCADPVESCLKTVASR